jgi:hypothetical protein
MSTQLPKGKTIVDVFADFMGYFFDLMNVTFRAFECNGKLIWDSVSNNIELVLTYPDGWGGPQQTQLRSAAIKAGIVPDTPSGRSRVHFVTEREARFNFCATHIRAGRDLKVWHPFPCLVLVYLIRSQPGEQVLIIDAGSETIDISAYAILNNMPLQVEELYEHQCELDRLS